MKSKYTTLMCKYMILRCKYVILRSKCMVLRSKYVIQRSKYMILRSKYTTIPRRLALPGKFIRLVGDVSLANMQTPQNVRVYLRFGSADHLTSKPCKKHGPLTRYWA